MVSIIFIVKLKLPWRGCKFKTPSKLSGGIKVSFAKELYRVSFLRMIWKAKQHSSILRIRESGRLKRVIKLDSRSGLLQIQLHFLESLIFRLKRLFALTSILIGWPSDPLQDLRVFYDSPKLQPRILFDLVAISKTLLSNHWPYHITVNIYKSSRLDNMPHFPIGTLARTGNS